MPRDLIPEGYYYGVVTDHGFGPDEGKSGTPYISVAFDLTDMKTGEAAGSITAFLYLSDKAIEKTAEKLRAIGYVGSDASELADGSKLRGMRCQVQVIHDTFDDKDGNKRTTAKVGWINPEDYVPSGVAHSESSAKANASRLSALLRTKPAVDKAGDPIPF